MANEKKELKGAEFDLHLVNGELVVSVDHVGSDASANLSIKVDAKKFYSLAIDKLEELIPGDQKAMAKALKAVLDGIEF